MCVGGYSVCGTVYVLSGTVGRAVRCRADRAMGGGKRGLAAPAIAGRTCDRSSRRLKMYQSPQAERGVRRLYEGAKPG